MNAFFTSKRGQSSLPRGVSRVGSKFLAAIQVDGRKLGLGRFLTVEDAYEAYVKAKNDEARKLAEKYQDEIDSRVYARLSDFDFETSFSKLLEGVGSER